MRNSHFPGWGRPFEFNSQLLARVGRQEEARDVVSARCWPSCQLRPLCCLLALVFVATVALQDRCAYQAANMLPSRRRSQARLSLRLPWWSFADGFAAVRDAAEMSGDMAAVRRALEDQDDMSNMPGMKTVIKTGGRRWLWWWRWQWRWVLCAARGRRPNCVVWPHTHCFALPLPLPLPMLQTSRRRWRRRIGS
jgi:hypothetical protein